MEKAFSVISDDQKLIGQGFVLPSGMVALCREDGRKSIYPSMEKFLSLQKLMNREVIKSDVKEFYLQRDEDVTGLSGIGIVAHGCHFGQFAVIEWCTDFGSINWFNSVDELLESHGHEGKTRIVFLDE